MSFRDDDLVQREAGARQQGDPERLRELAGEWDRRAGTRDEAAAKRDEAAAARDRRSLRRDSRASVRDQRARRPPDESDPGFADRWLSGVDRDHSAGDRADSYDDRQDAAQLRKEGADARQRAAKDRARAADLAAAAADQVANLTEALRTSRQIGTALGIVMALRRVTQERAFDLLRSVSQATHRKLRDVAADIVFTGELPDAPNGERRKPAGDVYRSAPPRHSAARRQPQQRSPMSDCQTRSD